ncbi:MAG: hypothetical protein U0359_02600 [Byssovorax sp.]
MHIGAYAVHSCAVLADGTAKCWGDNSVGEIGDGTNTNTRDGGGRVQHRHRGPGYRHTCAMLGDNTVKCWGDNANGELGNLLTVNSNTAVDVYGFPCGGGSSPSQAPACPPPASRGARAASPTAAAALPTAGLRRWRRSRLRAVLLLRGPA